MKIHNNYLPYIISITQTYISPQVEKSVNYYSTLSILVSIFEILILSPSLVITIVPNSSVLAS